jgi:hypothetical protein
MSNFWKFKRPVCESSTDCGQNSAKKKKKKKSKKKGQKKPLLIHLFV